MFRKISKKVRIGPKNFELIQLQNFVKEEVDISPAGNANSLSIISA